MKPQIKDFLLKRLRDNSSNININSTSVNNLNDLSTIHSEELIKFNNNDVLGLLEKLTGDKNR